MMVHVDEWRKAVATVHLLPNDTRITLCGEEIIAGPASAIPYLPVSAYGVKLTDSAGYEYSWCAECENHPDLPLALLGAV